MVLDLLKIALFLIGVALVLAGVAMIYVPLAFIAGGAGALRLFKEIVV